MTAKPPAALDLAPEICSDLGIEPGACNLFGSASANAGSRLLELSAGAPSLPDAAAASAGLAPAGVLFARAPGEVPERELARWRNSFWPRLHAVAIYEEGSFGLRRRTLQGRESLQAAARPARSTLALRRVEHVLSPAATVEKFDGNAEGWDGDPKGPGYGHFRWMRRYVGLYAAANRGARILDFGCGAGWVGVEAALQTPEAKLCFFDPSPAMVRIAERNAAEGGLPLAIGRTGFGEHPPFPASGEPPFELVISSGVVSFSPDFEAWLDGLVGTLAPGACLVIGDIHRDALGFRRRRRKRALLPVRELAARTPDEVCRGLVARGLEHLETSYYQLSWPIPQLMHLNETKLKGLFSWPLLALNRLGAAGSRRLHIPTGGAFDSWVMRLVKPC